MGHKTCDDCGYWGDASHFHRKGNRVLCDSCYDIALEQEGDGSGYPAGDVKHPNWGNSDYQGYKIDRYR